ncbi:glycerophosphoryl diester phosphodiesterase [Candidatus Koribacter versatilis Ellin345]|uniref:Glycerophosphoryl diester phosphodiesterase n=1 Tax=Koribacter versatilis (strain Ellin345) TaxID=204669 RepID=Q1IPL6_KORVE|nr:glycerophosphodiester phosphodiesterase [Candidatus Koribacter versatilis]ABF41184.1 glycerophosphoryl diester phosphodiesterase [Candidatus Koribacter versatilis Ellin345]
MGEQSKRPLLLGHRGQRHTRRKIIRYFQPQTIPPDNTIAAFELTMQRGCDGFEFDVRYTHDRRGVICHDPDYRGQNVANTKYEALLEGRRVRAKRTDYPPEEQIPCLEDVMARFAERAYLDIEVKIPGFEHEIVAALRQHPPTKGFVVSSFLPAVLRRFYELDPELPLGYIFGDRKLMAEWRDLPVSVVIPNVKLASDDLVQEWHAAEKQVFVWTVNRESEMRRLGLWGVDAIISDDTELLVKVLGGSK